MYDPAARVTPLVLSLAVTVSAAYYISFYALPRRRKRKLSFEYYSSGIQKQSQLWQPDIGPKDVISRLPDEILVSILERMPSCMDVARTSAVSKRWASLYKSVPDVDICCKNLVTARSTPHGQQRGPLINYRAERILQLRSGSKIRRLVFCCCLIKAYRLGFNVFLYYLGTFGVEKLVGKCCCGTRTTTRHCDQTFHCCFISKMPYLKHLELQLYPLQPNTTPPSSKSLRTLCLSRVKLIPGALECVLLDCLSLQSMTFDFCECPPRLSFVGGPNLQLESLKMQQCEGLEKITLCASNLLTLEIDSLQKVSIVFDHVPRLQTAYIGFKYMNTMNYVRSTLPTALAQLKSLSFATRGDIYQHANSRPLWANNTFRNLEQLRLRLRHDSTKMMNLLLLIPFLQSCPILEELHLDIDGDDVRKSDINGTAEEKKRAAAVVAIHSALKKVEITGFRGTKNEIEFARDLLKCGAVLEQMQICRCPKWHVEFVGWMKCDKPAWDYYTRETILSRLRGQALSETARLTLRHFPTYTDAWWRRACNTD